MEDVINHGTGYPARAVGFNAPAAGKTGTSRDGWFAGYTSNLLCIVWVGFDDNRDLGLAGGAAAAPLWGEFMKRAVALPAYSKTVDFEPPDGVVDVSIDTQSGQLASNACPETQSQTQSEVEYFIEGTEPTQGCQAQGAQTGGVLALASFWQRLRSGSAAWWCGRQFECHRKRQGEISQRKPKPVRRRSILARQREEKGIAGADIWYLRRKQETSGWFRAAEVIRGNQGDGR